MDHEKRIKGLRHVLEAIPGCHVVTFEIGPTITDEDREIVKAMECRDLPPPVMRLLEQANGIAVVWDAELAGRPVQGSLNIADFRQAAFRLGAMDDDAPLEGILWNDEFPPETIERLQAMTIFEAIAGTSAYLTYRSGDADAWLFHVDGDTITPLQTDFSTTVDLLLRYAGADRLRAALVQEDWQEVIDGDPVLQAIDALA